MCFASDRKLFLMIREMLNMVVYIILILNQQSELSHSRCLLRCYLLALCVIIITIISIIVITMI